MLLKECPGNQGKIRTLNLTIQSLIGEIKNFNVDLLNLEICYIGQSNSSEYKITDRLKSHENLLKLYASISKDEPHKEINLILLKVNPDSPQSFLLGGFDRLADPGFDFKESDLENVLKSKIPFVDMVNCAEALLIHYFKPVMNKDFKKNLLEKNLKTIKYFRDKGYRAVSFELNLSESNQKVFSKIIPAEDFSFINYDMTSEENNKKFLNFS